MADTGFKPASLKPILLNTSLQQSDQRLYQFLNQLLQGLINLNTFVGSISTGGGGSTIIQQIINGQGIPGEDGEDGGDNYYLLSSSVTDDDVDYVVASDGATPTPSPLDDGAGNFIYVPYTP